MNLCLKNEFRRCRPLLGTFVEIAVKHDDNQAQSAINSAFAMIERVHQLMSFHDPQSEISRLNALANEQIVSVSSELYRVLQCAKEFYVRTQGLFDITIACELLKRKILPEHAFLTQKIDTHARMNELELLPGNRVRIQRPMIIDLGGIAKGFAVDQAVEVLQNSGIESGMVNAGGDIRVLGGEPVEVAIKIIGKRSLSFKRVKVGSMAIATSSVRAQRMSLHNLSNTAYVKMPSGQYLNRLKTASVFADHCMIADALTKVVLLGSEMVTRRCLKHYRASAYVFGPDGELEKEFEYP